MSSAIIRQFSYKLINPGVTWVNYPHPPSLIGHACDSCVVGLSKALAETVRIMQSRTVGWHTDVADLPESSLVLLQVISGSGFRVQGKNKNPEPQPIGTVILLDHSKPHRLLAPHPRLKEIWTAQYVEISRTLPAKLNDEALAQLLEVEWKEKKYEKLLTHR